MDNKILKLDNNYTIEDSIICVTEGFRILLKYYDKQYTKGLFNRENLHELLTKVECATVNTATNAMRLTHQQTKQVNA